MKYPGVRTVTQMPIKCASRGAPDASAFAMLVQIFTAGPHCMEFSARVYGATWKIREQGLPADLMARWTS